ncbi:hypothetical protein ACODT5_13155 [Streptomyces sp. 5.8]|uniref:hypothetical protein n=1 Tax=Streptomyces sp. 5.8 TaxID=3406571 RepID=UPI003BB538BC
MALRSPVFWWLERIGRPASRDDSTTHEMRATRSFGKDTLARSSAGVGNWNDFGGGRARTLGRDAGKADNHSVVTDASGTRKLSAALRPIGKNRLAE